MKIMKIWKFLWRTLLVLGIVSWLVLVASQSSAQVAGYDFKKIKLSPDPAIRYVAKDTFTSMRISVDVTRPSTSETILFTNFLIRQDDNGNAAWNSSTNNWDFLPTSEVTGNFSNVSGGSLCNRFNFNYPCLSSGQTSISYDINMKFSQERLYHLFLTVEMYRDNAAQNYPFLNMCFVPIAVVVGNPAKPDRSLIGQGLFFDGPRVYNNLTVGSATIGGAFANITHTSIGQSGGTWRCAADQTKKVQLFIDGELRVNVMGQIDVTQQGYRAATGPGAGESPNKTSGCYETGIFGGGGSYGGSGRKPSGGTASGVSAPTYGSTSPPLDYGSGGGTGHKDKAIRNPFGVQIDCEHNSLPGGAGGGAVYIKANRVNLRNGKIMADGYPGNYMTDLSASGGGGAGGAVAIIANEFFSEQCYDGLDPVAPGQDYANAPGGATKGTVTTSPDANSVSNVGGVFARGARTEFPNTGGGGGGGGRIYVEAPADKIKCARRVTITPTPTSASITKGQTVTFDLKVCLEPLEGTESSRIALSRNQPGNLNVTLSTTQVTRSASSPCGDPANNPKLTVSTSNATIGTHTINILGQPLDLAAKNGSVDIPVTVSSVQFQAQLTLTTLTTTPIKIGEQATFEISYQAQGVANGSSRIFCPNQDSGWVRLRNTFPFPGMIYVVNSASSPPGEPTNVNCDVFSSVWDTAKLGGTNQSQVQGRFTFKGLARDTICGSTRGQKTVENLAVIEVFNSWQQLVASDTKRSNVTIDCPVLTVTGNIGAASSGEQVASSSTLRIAAPSLVSAGGVVTAERASGVTTVENYPIDLSGVKTLLTKIYQRLFREVAKSCAPQFSRTNFPDGSICLGLNSAGGARVIKIVQATGGTATILAHPPTPGVTNDDVVVRSIQANLGKSIGIMIPGERTVYITDTNYRGVVIYAPDATVDFGQSWGAPGLQSIDPTRPAQLDFKGVLIAKRFINFDKRIGTIEFDPQILKTPPQGMRYLLPAAFREAVP